jgi:hypothetical protein
VTENQDRTTGEGSWIVVSFLATTLNLCAQPESPANLLRRAYYTLAIADHDYKGHRVEAMKQVEAAIYLAARTRSSAAVAKATRYSSPFG